MHDFLPGVITWPWFSERHGYDFNGTLVLHQAGNLCVDPVEPSPAFLDRLAHEGVSSIVITNRNHTRAANTVRERTGALALMHPADVGYAATQGTSIDGEIHVGQRLGPFVVVGVPGKSPGEIALHDRERRLLIVGDAVIGYPPGRLSLLPERVIDDPTLLRASVERLLDVDFDVLIVGDGAPIRAGARDRLRELVASFSRV